jgi:hypothetical protein
VVCSPPDEKTASGVDKFKHRGTVDRVLGEQSHNLVHKVSGCFQCFPLVSTKPHHIDPGRSSRDRRGKNITDNHAIFDDVEGPWGTPDHEQSLCDHGYLDLYWTAKLKHALRAESSLTYRDTVYLCSRSAFIATLELRP